MAAKKISGEQWETARMRYVSDPAMSHAAIAQLLDCSPNLVSRRAKKEGWVKGILDDAPGPVGDVCVNGGGETAAALFTEKTSPPPTQAPTPEKKEPPAPAEDAPEPRRAEVVYPAGFEQKAALIAAQVVAAQPVRSKSVSGLVTPFPSTENMPATRSTETLIRWSARERMMATLERRRQRLVALDAAFVRAARAGDPKSATAALNLARAQEVLARLESGHLLEEMEFHINMLRSSRDVAAPVEPEAAAQVIDPARDAELAAQIRAEEACVPYSAPLPPGWK